MRFRFNFTSKLFSIASLATLGLLAGPLAQGGSAVKPELRASFKHDVLTMINRDRAAHGLRPVELDPHASELGDRYCETQIVNKTTGHFTTDGVAPYMRYSFAGGNDGVSENAAAWSANYSFADSTILDMIRRSHRSMMLEVAPNDGHRRTLLDPDATHVGIGLAWEKGEFRMVHEFVRRYIDWTRTPSREITTVEQPLIEGKPLRGYSVDAVSVYYEPDPQPLSAFVASRIETYRLPKTRRDYLPRKAAVLRQLSSDRTRGVARVLRRSAEDALIVQSDGAFSFVPSLENGAGIYTVVVWVKPANNGSAVAASNIALRVRTAAGGSLRMLGTN
jgi:uncharacterized protein YkwD